MPVEALYGHGLLNTKGELIVRGPAMEQLKVGDQPLPGSYVEKGLAGPVISDPYFLEREAELKPDSITSDPNGLARIIKICKPTVAFIHPVKENNGHVAGLVVVWVKAEWLWGTFDAGQRDYFGQALAKLWPDNSIALYDGAGVQIGNSRDPRMLFHPRQALEARTAQTMIDEHRFGKWTKEFLSDVKAVPEPIDRDLDAAEPTQPISESRGGAR